MIIIIIQKLRTLIGNIYNSPGHNFLLHNAILGNISSQYNLAKFYFTEKNDYIEAYAWAEVAFHQHHPQAYEIKNNAEKKLNSEQIKEAWKKARNYKMSFNQN